MLINKGVSTDELVTIRTLSGEEIIGKLVEDNDKFISLNKPRALVATQNGAALAPFLFTTEAETVAFAKHALMTAPLPTAKDASDLYIQQTTGIALAK
jgi:hypothetical protein